MVMSGEQSPASDRIVEELRDRPGQRHAVESACSTADFIQDHQTLWGGVIEDIGGFDHLDHEGALPAAQLIRRADTSEDSIHNAKPGRFGWDEAARLRQQRE